MTQVINKKLMKCCDCCKSHFDKPCAWLSLGNEYCDEIMETQQVIDQLTNNWNELEEWLKSEIESFKEIVVNQGLFIDKELHTRLTARIKLIETILDKMKKIKEGNNVKN